MKMHITGTYVWKWSKLVISILDLILRILDLTVLVPICYVTVPLLQQCITSNGLTYGV